MRIGLGSTPSVRQQEIELGVARTQRSFPEVPGIHAEELQEALAGGEIVLVDVRTPDEQGVSALPGAIDVDEFERRVDELAGSSVITYCTIGYRSSRYAEKLMHQGWDVKNLTGSILAWTHIGGPLVDPNGRPTRRVHVFSEKWNLAADGYESIW